MTRRLTLLMLVFAPVVVLAQQSSAELFAERMALRFNGARHFVMEPDHPLRDDEKRDLAAKGLDVQDVMAGGRYLVRVAPDATIAGDVRIRSMRPLTSEQKIFPSAYASAKGRAFATVRIVFNREVGFESARQMVAGAGGSVIRPLQTNFQSMRSLRVMVPSTELERFASNEGVRAIIGTRHLRTESHNNISAQLSNVNVVQAAPYNLTGAGVTLSYFELNPGDTAHPEFQGRLTTHFPAGSELGAHPTHVAGTMIAAGLDPRAKGMAPAAVLHQYLVDNNGDWLDSKDEDPPALGAIADNNSWGFTLGWCRNKGSCDQDWTWLGDDDLIGGYFEIDTILDAITRERNYLMVHSAGNDASNPGPTEAPFLHKHDLEGHDENVFFCYSADGSGSDCPAPCVGNDSHGNPLCETVRHPVNAPFLSIGATASSKNVIAVGSVDSSKNIANYSSRGPTRDGRIKPDVVSRGGTASGNGRVYSTIPNGGYGLMGGTSMAAPVVTGISALLTEQWRKTFNGATPLPATIKALLIDTAEDRGNPGPDYTYGFGLVNAQAATDLIIADNRTGSRIKIDSIGNGQQTEIPLTVSAPQNLKVTIVWTDPEILFGPGEYAFPSLVNNLDLKVIDGTGNVTQPYVLNKDAVDAPATRGGNTVDNVELVEIANAPAGNYRIVVSGTRVDVDGPQQYTLVANAGLGAAIPPCVDIYEPNETESAGVALVSGNPVSGRACTASDVDVFRADVSGSGAVNVTITAGDTPLRVSLSGSTIGAASVDVPAGATRTVSGTTSGSGDVFIRVVPNGAIGSDPSYRLTATFPITGAPPRRGVRH